MFDESTFYQLWDLKLSHNQFASLRCFGYLPKLKVLKMKQNKIQNLFCKLNEDGYPKGLFGLPSLEYLDLSFNCIQNLQGLQYVALKEL